MTESLTNIPKESWRQEVADQVDNGHYEIRCNRESKSSVPIPFDLITARFIEGK
jgi:hypothetical protein